MRVIFLDCDGVLNSNIGWRRDNPDRWDYITPECLAQLKRICEVLPDVKVVFSSSWRFGVEPDMFQERLRELGAPITIIGKTPRTRILISAERGAEIQAWLDEHGAEVDRFVILDDDNDMLHLMPQLVRTDSATGLTADKADEVIRRLK